MAGQGSWGRPLGPAQKAPDPVCLPATDFPGPWILPGGPHCADSTVALQKRFRCEDPSDPLRFGFEIPLVPSFFSVVSHQPTSQAMVPGGIT
ncbi:hypothetical protein AK812_SmicGene42403 [Symbiodinium microadriaticum]|uniref:Uncharacterized protein n=1 Tax=Symbiodinium microadriaticum TaxID=2951 RepID=A0A1Q9C3N1_SYMMI|nr:hypothetical protein AK812_SmicGene42403 [Symbiodinium microadriaticum]